MDFMLIDAKYSGELKLDEKTLDYCLRYRTIAVYASVQYVHKIKEIVQNLEEKGIRVITSKPARTDTEFQILGCDCNYADLNLKEDPDAFLYIGDGLFHPMAIALSLSEFRDIIQFDPVQNEHTLLARKEIERILKKQKGGLVKFLSSRRIGVIITTKPGQEQFKSAKHLEKKYPGKRFYYFIENTIDYSRLEDFPFIECWINTACPRIGLDDSSNLPFSMINLTEALK